jgi:hypothetical protein
VIIPFGWWSGASDIACADVATAKAKQLLTQVKGSIPLKAEHR